MGLIYGRVCCVFGAETISRRSCRIQEIHIRIAWFLNAPIQTSRLTVRKEFVRSCCLIRSCTYPLIREPGCGQNSLCPTSSTYHCERVGASEACLGFGSSDHNPHENRGMVFALREPCRHGPLVSGVW